MRGRDGARTDRLVGALQCLKRVIRRGRFPTRADLFHVKHGWRLISRDTVARDSRRQQHRPCRIFTSREPDTAGCMRRAVCARSRATCRVRQPPICTLQADCLRPDDSSPIVGAPPGTTCLESRLPAVTLKAPVINPSTALPIMPVHVETFPHLDTLVPSPLVMFHVKRPGNSGFNTEHDSRFDVSDIHGARGPSSRWRGFLRAPRFT